MRDSRPPGPAGGQNLQVLRNKLDYPGYFYGLEQISEGNKVTLLKGINNTGEVL